MKRLDQILPFCFTGATWIVICCLAVSCNTEQLTPEEPVPKYCLELGYDSSGLEALDTVLEQAYLQEEFPPELEELYTAIESAMTPADSALLHQPDVDSLLELIFLEITDAATLNMADSFQLVQGNTNNLERIVERATSLPASFAPYQGAGLRIAQLKEVYQFLPQPVHTVRLCRMDVLPFGPLEERYAHSGRVEPIRAGLLAYEPHGLQLAESIEDCLKKCNATLVACIIAALLAYKKVVLKLAKKLANRIKKKCKKWKWLKKLKLICVGIQVAWFNIKLHVAAFALAKAIAICGDEALKCRKDCDDQGDAQVVDHWMPQQMIRFNPALKYV